MNDLSKLLFSMAIGLLPENLTMSEVKLLENEYGLDWFNFLGYSEPEYKKPKSMGG